MRNIPIQTLSLCTIVCALAIVTGCQSTDHGAAQSPTEPATTAAQPAAAEATPPATSPSASAQASTSSIFRIKAGTSAAFTDSSGNVWQPDQGFEGGDVIERDASTSIANTKDPGLFLTEHYGMNSFSCNVPNGKYVAKLYFAETFDGITGPGQRVFSFSVQGHEFKDFDVFVKAGGANRAYIETVPVEITDGKFTITFTSNVENPQINAIEIMPQS